MSVQILAVELADLDGDGPEELAAIEAPAEEAARRVAVRRWHGWGFGPVWRSPPAKYHDLLLLPAEGDQPTALSVASGALSAESQRRVNLWANPPRFTRP